jgi:hypothetical protein
MPTNIDHKELRRKLEARYFVQWVTKRYEQGHLQVVGHCVRDQGDPQWKTVFEHKDKIVCEKICQILNEGANNVRGT